MNRISAALSFSASLLLLASAAQAASVDPALVLDAAREAAQRNLPDTIAEIEVHSLSLRSAPTVPDGAAVSVRVRGDGGDDWIGHTNLDVLVTVDGVPLDPVRGSVQIIAWVQVPVLREPLARGQRIAGDDLGLVLREADRLPGGVLRHVEDIVGRSTRRDLGLAALVRATDLTAVVDAEKNRPVTLLVGSGALRVTASGVLREDAALGSLVAVWVPSTGSTLHGILRSADLVEMPFNDPPEVP
jgi:flagella basal body P-ring formation protein FlgA